jgi:hypothetical protein
VSDLILLPDVEQLVVDFLLDQVEILAIIAGEAVTVDAAPVTSAPTDRVYSILPTNKVFPAVRVTRYGGVTRTRRPRHIDAPTVQIDAFARLRKTAWTLAETCGAALAARLTGVHPAGVVSGVDVDGPVPGDSGFEKIHMRLLTATIYTHPQPLAGS